MCFRIEAAEEQPVLEVISDFESNPMLKRQGSCESVGECKTSKPQPCKAEIVHTCNNEVVISCKVEAGRSMGQEGTGQVQASIAAG